MVYCVHVQRIKHEIALISKFQEQVHVLGERKNVTNCTNLETQTLARSSSRVEEVTINKSMTILEPDKPEEWMIIAFSDKTYLPAAKIWYSQLSSLGYQNHCIIALDDIAHKTLIQDNYRVIKSYKFFDKETDRSNKLWLIRLHTLHDLITKQQKNVFISDVDSIWVNYRDLSLLPKEIDAFYGTGKTYPNFFFDKYGFVLCGCIGAYRASSRTEEFFKTALRKCGKHCDDQYLINEVYMNWGIVGR